MQQNIDFKHTKRKSNNHFLLLLKNQTNDYLYYSKNIRERLDPTIKPRNTKSTVDLLYSLKTQTQNYTVYLIVKRLHSKKDLWN